MRQRGSAPRELTQWKTDGGCNERTSHGVRRSLINVIFRLDLLLLAYECSCNVVESIQKSSTTRIQSS